MTDRRARDTSPLPTLRSEDAAVGLCIVAPDGRVLGADSTWLRSVGRAREQVIGQSLASLVPGIGGALRAAWTGAAAAVAAPRRGGPPGREAWWEDQLSPLEMEGGTGALVASRETVPALRHDGGTDAAWHWRGEGAEELLAMRALIDALPLGVGLVQAAPGREPVMLACNAFHRDLVGSQPESGTALAELPFRVFRADRRTPLAPADWTAPAAIRSGEPTWNVETHLLRPDGSWRVALVSAIPLRAATGEAPTRAVVMIVDVTEQRRADEALRASEAKFRSYVERAPLALFVVDGRGRYVDANPAALEMVGRDAAGLSRLAITDVLPEADREAALRDFSRLVETGRLEGEYRLLRPDGRHVRAALRAVRIAEDRYVGFAQDVTARREAELALGRRERFLSTILRTALDGLWVVADEGRLVLVNDAYAEMSGYAREELERMRVSDVEVVETAAETAARFRRILRQGADRFETRHRRKDGRIIDVEVSARFLDEEGGRTVGFLRDITQRKQAEAALREGERRYRALAARLQAVREEEKSRLARDLHDEMGQLLTALAAGLGWVERRVDAAPGAAQLQDVVDRVVELSDLAAESLRAVQRIAAEQRTVELERLGLGPALDVEVRRFSERSGIGAVADVSPELPDLGHDVATALYRVVQECLTNVARHAGAARAWVAVRVAGDALELLVEDDGRGFGAEAIDRPRSLGLIGMQERAESVGGTIAFERSPRGGAAVRVRVPFPAPAAEERPPG